MLSQRAAGILLHPTSLPGPFGIGELGSAARTFVDFLVAAKQRRWQVLPLGPTGYGDSPYASFSSFAGNQLLISLEELVADSWLSSSEISPPAEFNGARVPYGALIAWKTPRLRIAAERFLQHATAPHMAEFQAFCEEQSPWLPDYALFTALKEVFDAQAQAAGVEGATWCNYWDEDLRFRNSATLTHWRNSLASDIAIQKVWQFWFFSQWAALKRYANERGIQIIGDLPIFVALDSSDVWSAPEEFRLDSNLQPTHVAGVPPDYFAVTGQRWGNPLYNWPRMQASGFRWWIDRFRGIGQLVDWVRVDHFRGFAANWSVPAEMPTAEHGVWEPAPGTELFAALLASGANVPIIAEDLGEITPDVDALRESLGLPGMRVLQFAFDAAEGRSVIFLPHNHEPNSVVYTGTHDNDTTCGWYTARSIAERERVDRYLGKSCDEGAITWELIRLSLASVCRLSVTPMQDLLNLGTAARMNLPGTIGPHNWSWRMPADYASGNLAERLADLTELYGRAGE